MSLSAAPYREFPADWKAFKFAGKHYSQGTDADGETIQTRHTSADKAERAAARMNELSAESIQGNADWMKARRAAVAQYLAIRAGRDSKKQEAFTFS